MSTGIITTEPPRSRTRRPVVFFLLGVLLFVTTGFLLYDRFAVHTPLAPPAQAYTYNISQSLEPTIQYRQSSFFSTVPDATVTAYIADLTDRIDAALHYQLEGNRATDLHYTYGAEAVLQNTSGSAASEEGVANVWTRQFTLIRPVTGSKHTKLLVLNPRAELPFSGYLRLLNQFKDAFSAPLNSALVVTFHVQVNGKVDGAPFEDRKVSTITIPLDQPVYRLALKYINSEPHTIFPPQSSHIEDIVGRYELPLALIVAGLGLGCAVYGLRRQRLRSPHQRELDRIFRYNDGIIVRASHATNLANKNVVTVQSFDDLLNLEEEIKSPIIASKVNDRTTHFLITRDDVVYVYTLGDPVPFRTANAHKTSPQPGEHEPDADTPSRRPRPRVDS